MSNTLDKPPMKKKQHVEKDYTNHKKSLKIMNVLKW